LADKILYCVLNWGLGHASRSVPIIQNLIKKGRQVTLASDGMALSLLEKEFPSIPKVELPAYNIEYKYESITLNILSQSIKILKAVKSEKQFIEGLIRGQNFSTIVSDNRFGCYHPSCKNVFIGHQIRLIHKRKFVQAAGTRFNTSLINKFDECWVPDLEDSSSLSGEMSHNVRLDIPIRYIGPQSRFQVISAPPMPSIKTLSILSGPEPQRTILQELLLSQLKLIAGKHVIISGLDKEDLNEGSIKILGLRDVAEISRLIAESKFLISRSGYSSLMDFAAMQRKAILIPTPGQTEQEYLARMQPG